MKHLFKMNPTRQKLNDLFLAISQIQLVQVMQLDHQNPIDRTVQNHQRKVSGSVVKTVVNQLYSEWFPIFIGILSRDSIDKKLDRQQSDKVINQTNTNEENDVIVQQPDELTMSPDIVSHM